MDNEGSRHELEMGHGSATLIDGKYGFVVRSACASVLHLVLAIANAPVCGTARHVSSGVIANLQNIMSVQKACFRKARDVGGHGKYAMSSRPNQIKLLCSKEAVRFVYNLVLADLRRCDENWVSD